MVSQSTVLALILESELMASSDIFRAKFGGHLNRKNCLLTSRKRQLSCTGVNSPALPRLQRQVTLWARGEVERCQFLMVGPQRVEEDLTPVRLPAACNLDRFKLQWPAQLFR